MTDTELAALVGAVRGRLTSRPRQRALAKASNADLPPTLAPSAQSIAAHRLFETLRERAQQAGEALPMPWRGRAA